MTRTTARLSRPWASFGFIFPAVAILAGFVLYPIVFNVQASVLDWNGIGTGVFIGAENFAELVTDPIFLTAIRNSLLWIVCTIVPSAIIGFMFALVLNRRIRGRNIYRALIFIPAILSPVVVGFVWQRMLDPFNGVIAQIGRAAGTQALSVPWLSSPSTAIFAVMFVNVWMSSGFAMLFYLSGLQLIDESVLEAARVDGASWWQTVWYVTLPMLRNTHLSWLLLGIIGSLKTFELVYVLTQGGPNNASQMLPTYAFLSAFQLQRTGYASAISVVLVVLSVGISLLMIRVFGSGFIAGKRRSTR